MENIIPFTRPSIARDDLEAVLKTMVADRIGASELAERYAQELAQQHRCVGGVVFRDIFTATTAVYALCAQKQKRTLLFSPLTDIHWIRESREYGGFDIQYAPLIPGTIIADYKQQLDRCDCVVVDNTLGHIPDYDTITQGGKMIIEIIGAGLGGVSGGKRVGSFGDIVIIELESDQIVTCGGGTAVLCRKEGEWRMLKQRTQRRGHRGMIADVDAALGIAQLRRLPQFIKKRKAIEEKYQQRIKDVGRLCYQMPFSTRHTPHSFPIRYRGSRKEVCKFARAHGVEVQVAFTESAAAHHLDEIAIDDTERKMYLDEIVNQTVLFPLYPHLSSESIQKIEQVIANLP